MIKDPKLNADAQTLLEEHENTECYASVSRGIGFDDRRTFVSLRAAARFVGENRQGALRTEIVACKRDGDRPIEGPMKDAIIQIVMA